MRAINLLFRVTRRILPPIGTFHVSFATLAAHVLNRHFSAGPQFQIESAGSYASSKTSRPPEKRTPRTMCPAFHPTDSWNAHPTPAPQPRNFPISLSRAGVPVRVALLPLSLFTQNPPARTTTNSLRGPDVFFYRPLSRSPGVMCARSNP